ncbi:MAG TPA: hypothetical protein VFP27_16425 [Mycobacterium sp.]|nr:hypothetical protein [Mycobacterium sp.]
MSTPLTPTNIRKGLRVLTPLGPGSLNYVRFDHLGPDPNVIAAASVLLDARLMDGRRGTYSGTIFAAAKVTVDVDFYGTNDAANSSQ